MVTVARIVEKIIKNKPFVQEALSKGIINNAALAESIMPIVEREFNGAVKFSAVNMALRRLSEKLGKTLAQTAHFTDVSDISIRSDLVEITFYKIENIQKKIQKLYDVVDINSGDLLTITQGLNELMIITNKRHQKEVLTLFQISNVKKIIEGLASITINIPLESSETIGLFYIVTRALNWENINIVDVVSTLTEMTFIIKEKDTGHAFETLKDLIKENG
ncbi:hypothetical protein COV93_08545 [Candidatus Woesearchaeota archaeon CG11_big_fil_rev_8_21_14_0_20_43_8]|nr:MAG: hypothetical protein COV93_08545 [Candidatus Woesearchaeota archaeon CG11_big_fil_rev_8_21_14_0_20_43_8]PIO04723.1 MAG: hypothetical protein COT47_07790 [Candidatus Woesearchaeota archaeon CG08_land_8_20_14_0_20_43_7]